MEENKEANVYKEDYREELRDADEISADEEGFMQGYDEDANPSICAYCEKVLGEDIVEREIDGELYRFCSEEHAEKFERQKNHV
jgi:hypothetical protein